MNIKKIQQLMIILICMAIIVIMMCGATMRPNTWTDKQIAAHEIAELARTMGLDENNPIIVESKRIWQEEEDAKVAYTILSDGPNNGSIVSALKYLGRYYITGYDTCIKCCGKTDGITASGTTATVGRTCAANGIDFGTRLYIDGIGERIVEDRGAMKGNTIDVLCENHPACYAITGYYDVYVIDE